MKKSLFGPIIAGLAVLLIAAMFVFFYVSLNRMEKKLTTLQTTIVTDSAKVTSIVNFLNSSAPQTNATTK
jgi:YbbR domain-containing protein